MNYPRNKYEWGDEIHPAQKYMLLIATGLIIGISVFMMIDAGFGYETANTIAEVTYKDMRTPEIPGDSPYFLAIRIDGKAYHLRVPKSYYNQVEKGSMVLVAELHGRFTNRIYKSWLFDLKIPLQRVSGTPKKPTTEGARFDRFALHLIHDDNCPVLSCRVVFNPQIATSIS